MDLLPSADQTEIVNSVAEILREQAPLETVRSYTAPGDLSAIWSQLAELGLFGLAISTDCGGIGLGLAEEVLAFRELGRALTPGPILGTMLGAHLAEEARHPELASRLANGEAKVALAEPYRDPSATAGGTVNGTFRVTDPTGAELVLAATPTGAALLDAATLTAERVSSTEPTVELGTTTLSNTRAVAWADTGSTWWRGTAYTAALATGNAEATRDMSAAYARLREQYGKPIGTFQAVKHRCADMALRAEAAYFQTVLAALAWSADSRHSTTHLAAARTVATDASRTNAADNIQNHGAMGFSEEVDAHLYLRRSLLLETTLGTERWHLEHIADTEELNW